MAREVTAVVAEPRESFGKGAARKLRVLGKIPAVIYGHGTEPVHVSLPSHRIGLLLRRKNMILELDLAGAKQLVLVKDVQKDPVKAIIEHIDLIVVRKGEKVVVDVYIHLEGEALPGNNVNQDANTISLEAEATHIPESITVSIAGATDGVQIYAKDLVLPAGSSLISDPDTLIVAITTAGEVDLGDAPEAAAAAAE